MSVAKGNCLDEYSRDCNIDNTPAILINYHVITGINRYLYCHVSPLPFRVARDYICSIFPLISKQITNKMCKKLAMFIERWCLVLTLGVM